jgi:hypothetical protein
MRAEGMITDQEFIKQKTALADRRAAIEGGSAEEAVNPEQVRRELNEITEPLTQLRQTWETLKSPYRQRFERLVLPAGFVNGKTRTAELGLLFQVFGQPADSESHVVYPCYWTWDGVNWMAKQTNTGPVNYFGHAAAYDRARAEVVMFVLGQTWGWDGSTWTMKEPTINPPCRQYPAMAYDAMRVKMTIRNGLLPYLTKK